MSKGWVLDGELVETFDMTDGPDVTACLLGTCACEEERGFRVIYDELVDELGDPTVLPRVVTYLELVQAYDQLAEDAEKSADGLEPEYLTGHDKADAG